LTIPPKLELALSPLTFLIMLGVLECGCEENGGVPKPNPTPEAGVDGTEGPGPNVPEGSPVPVKGGNGMGGGAAGVVDTYGEYGYGLVGPNPEPPVAGVVA